MFEKAPTTLDFVGREAEVLKYWKEKDIFGQSVKLREGREPFTFYDGPPTANGKPHIGHIETRAFKDLIPRYQWMKGRNVLRKAGWDTHGLPVELEVERTLGLDGKEQIEKYGIEPFIKACKQSVWKYKAEWEHMSDRVGFWMDMEDPYITYENSYIESVWWSLKQVWDKGLLYKGHKVVPYCPRCGTALSSHEVSQGYSEVTDMTAFVRFPVKGQADTYFYAWTTTPWTLPSNVALCVGPDHEYAKFRSHGETAIMAKALIAQVVGEDVEILETMKGVDLVGMEYEPLFGFARAIPDKPAWRVVADDYVTLTDGTGIVHIAPAFGEDDARVGRSNDLPFVQLVDARGVMDPRTPWGGLTVKQADPKIIEALKESGLLLKAEPHLHNYPFCWRCDTPLIYYARSTWFIRMTAIQEQLQASNQSVNWMPENIRDGRMGNFIDNVLDWGLSRERYWGTPLPVWVCGCGHAHMVGSVEELRRLGNNVPEDIELHRPYIDQVTLKCEACGGDMHRTPEVIDCWYDSGSMPFAQWHYPFENKEIFEANFPANFISEAIDQTRGWFYTLLAIGTLIFDRSPFENCLVLGHVQDKDGIKMSKHKGNVVDPWEVLDKQGADAVRWYFYAAGAPWLPSRFSGDMVSEVQRKFMGTLWNTYAFFTLYASIDGYDPGAKKANAGDFSLMDKWVLSRLNTLVDFVDKGLAEYKITETSRAIAAFVDELSNWYVRRCRERFWGKGLEGDKLAAFETLYTVLTTLTGLIAPYTPFMAESIYQNLVAKLPGAKPSVHLTDFPVSDPAKVDARLEEDMEKVIEVVQLGRACRANAGMKTRQTAKTLYVKGKALTSGMADLVADELNVKEVAFVDDARAFTTYKIKPQLRTVGPKYGKLVGAIGKALLEMDGNDVVDTFAAGNALKFQVDGSDVELSEADVLTEPMQKPGFVAEMDGGVTVVLDTNLTPELIEEGFVREFVSKVQTQRREAEFEVTDHILITLKTTERLADVVSRGGAEILRAALADGLAIAEPEGFVREWSINGEAATIGIRKA
jgi:isoleucyl-tRNA synthetase